jgi:hypothetical protein
VSNAVRGVAGFHRNWRGLAEFDESHNRADSCAGLLPKVKGEAGFHNRRGLVDFGGLHTGLVMHGESHVVEGVGEQLGIHAGTLVLDME